MLRLAVLVLLLANLGYAAWSRGVLHGAGTESWPAWARALAASLPSPEPSREPERLAQQIAPERIAVLGAPPAGQPADGPSAASAAADAAAAPPAGRCVQLAGLSDSQLAVLRIGLRAAMADERWAVRTSTVAPRWIVYIGKLPGAALAAKKAELRQLGVEYREVQTPAWAPGLALGTYSAEASAQQALRELQRQGVRTARVVQERPESSAHTVQWPEASAEELQALEALLARLAEEGLAGKALQPCP